MLEGSTCTVVVEPGDVLIINTRLWWHATLIPNTAHATDGLSFSYARDIYFNGDGGPDDAGAAECDMTNVDQLFAKVRKRLHH